MIAKIALINAKMISVIANGYNNMRIGIAKKMILVKPTLAIKKETIVKIKAYVL